MRQETSVLVVEDTKSTGFVSIKSKLTKLSFLPKLERVLDLSMMALLLGLLRTDLLAKEMSAVTRVIDILQNKTKAGKRSYSRKLTVC